MEARIAAVLVVAAVYVGVRTLVYRKLMRPHLDRVRLPADDIDVFISWMIAIPLTFAVLFVGAGIAAFLVYGP